MYAIYNLVLALFFPVIIFHLVVRGFRNRDYWKRWRERFGFIDRLAPGKRIWIHAVSVGETRAAALLVPRLQEAYPDHRLLITTMTPTGSAQVRSLFEDAVDHCYLPYDYPGAVSRFLDRTRPDLGIVMETELWPNLFRACGRREMPLLVSNVRMSEKSMNGYLRFARLARSTLECVQSFAVQTPADGERMMKLGAPAPRVHVSGSIKFELAIPASLTESAEVLRRSWGNNRAVWIAASTHEGEDESMLIAYQQLKLDHPELLLVLVPRHPERAASIARLVRRRGLSHILRSEHAGDIASETDVLIGDTLGELLLFMAAADVVFVGGSLVPTGGHNLLEPAALGKPVIVGPHTFNFLEITGMAVSRGAATRIRSSESLAPAVDELLGDAELRFRMGEAGRKMVEENRGALERNLKLIGDLLPPTAASAG
jgi:3-deoxy-D-manno-octulosonic-acid transferase